MRVIIFSNCLKIWCRFQKWSKKMKKKGFCFLHNCIWIGCGKFSLLLIKYLSIDKIPSEVFGTNKLSRNSQQTEWRFYLLLTETFSNSIFPGVMKNMIEVESCRFRKCFEIFNRMIVEWYCVTWLFGHWSNQVFGSLEFRKEISYEDCHFI